MQDLFQDKTEEIINILWTQVEKIYGSGNDVLEEIYTTEKNEKKFPSSVVKPHINDTGKSKPLFGNAINKVKEDKGYNNNNKSYKDYKNNRNKDSNNYRQRDNKYDRYNKGARNREERSETFRTVNVGDKKIILRNKQNKSRSGSKEGIRDRSREREGESNYDKEGNNYHYQQNYYPQRGFYQERGFPQRGYGRGNYAPYMMGPPGFMDPRR